VLSTILLPTPSVAGVSDGAKLWQRDAADDVDERAERLLRQRHDGQGGLGGHHHAKPGGQEDAEGPAAHPAGRLRPGALRGHRHQAEGQKINDHVIFFTQFLIVCLILNSSGKSSGLICICYHQSLLYLCTFIISGLSISVLHCFFTF